MSLTVTKYPKSQKVDIILTSDSGGRPKMLFFSSINLNFEVGDSIYVYNSIYTGLFEVYAIDIIFAGYYNVTFDTTYLSGTTDGFILIQDNIPVASNWHAAKNTPIYIELQRKDLTINSMISYYSGDLVVEIDETMPTELAAGQKLYIYSEGVYDGIFTIKAIQPFGLKTFSVEEDYISATYSGFVNSDNYRLQYNTEIVVTIDDTETTLNYYPDSSGQFKIDIHRLVQTILEQKDEFDYNTISHKDSNISNLFTFSYNEVYTGSAETATNADENYYICLAEKEFGQYANMWENLVRDGGDTPIAKFLSFGLNTAYVNSDGKLIFPFALCILSAVGILSRVEETYNINESLLATDADTLANAENSLNKIRLNGSYSDAVCFADISLKTSLTFVNHFSSVISDTDGIIDDSYGNQDGIFSEASCLLAVAGTKLHLPQDVDIVASYAVTNGGTAIPTLASGNEITFGAGTIFNLTFTDSVGNYWFFPCIELYSDDRAVAIVHGEVMQADSLVKYQALGAFTDIDYTTQDSYFYHINGMDKVSDGGSETIDIPKSPAKNRLYSKGMGDEGFYQFGMIPFA